MIAYIVAGALALVLLLLAYRAFGGAAARPVDPDVLLRAALAGAHAAEVRIGEQASSPPIAPAAAPESQRTHEAMRGARRLLDGCSQQLQQVDATRLDDVTAEAHSLMSVAVDELSWAARMLQAPAYAASPGMHSAAAELRVHAARCLDDARTMLRPSGVAEEVHSTP